MSNIQFLVPMLLCFAGTTAFAQLTEPKPSALRAQLTQQIRAGQLDQAIANVKAAAAALNPDKAQVSEALFMVSRHLFHREKYAESLELLQEITAKFGDSPTASLAWCGVGQVYERLGDEPKMVEALERGVSMPRVPTATNIMDAGDTHGYACERLGRHYVATRQWAKALDVYTQWKPNSWCGTCLAGMTSAKVDYLLLCLINLGRHQEAAELSLRSVVSGLSSQRVPELTLIRLYEESGQRKELLTLFEQLLTASKSIPAEGAFEHPGARANTEKHVQSSVRRLQAAIALIDEKDWTRRLEAFHQTHPEDGYSPAIEKNVVSWLAIRDPRQSIPVLREAMEADYGKIVTLAPILAAIDTPAAHRALVTLAIAKERKQQQQIYQQQMICGVIHAFVANPAPLIAEIQARVPEVRKRYTYNSRDPADPLVSIFVHQHPCSLAKHKASRGGWRATRA